MAMPTGVLREAGQAIGSSISNVTSTNSALEQVSGRIVKITERIYYAASAVRRHANSIYGPVPESADAAEAKQADECLYARLTNLELLVAELEQQLSRLDG